MKIVRRKSMTVDKIRERLRKAMAKETTTRVDCTKCDGKGYVEKTAPMSQQDVGRQLGFSSATVSQFLQGKSLSLENGLKLVAWLEALDDPLSVLDDDPDDDEDESDVDAKREARKAASTAAASAAIDAMNRPIQFGVSQKPDRQLTLAQVNEVRLAHSRGAKVNDLARGYGVSVRTIYRALEGEIQEGTVGDQRVVMQAVPGREPRIIGKSPAVDA